MAWGLRLPFDMRQRIIAPSAPTAVRGVPRAEGERVPSGMRRDLVTDKRFVSVSVSCFRLRLSLCQPNRFFKLTIALGKSSRPRRAKVCNRQPRKSEKLTIRPSLCQPNRFFKLTIANGKSSRLRREKVCNRQPRKSGKLTISACSECVNRLHFCSLDRRKSAENCADCDRNRKRNQHRGQIHRELNP